MSASSELNLKSYTVRIPNRMMLGQPFYERTAHKEVSLSFVAILAGCGYRPNETVTQGDRA